MMICAVINGPSLQEIEQALLHSNKVELRLDNFAEINPEEILKLKNKCSLPMIFTLRPERHGGAYRGSESNRLDTLLSLAKSLPEFIDVEHDVSEEFFAAIQNHFPATQMILSYHNFEDTPGDLDAIFAMLQERKTPYCKVAVMARSSNDALRLMLWAKKTHVTYKNLIAISMGPEGKISRILSNVIGNPFTYASQENHAPGILSSEILTSQYGHPHLSKSSAIYGLIGDPVHKSISDVSHNAFFQKEKFDAVYVKMKVTQEELPEFLSLAKELPFAGLSVTMPLKEVVVNYVDQIKADAQTIGALNTLRFDDGVIAGCNTDGVGALDAMECHGKVAGRRMVILGAGGTARAIACEAHRRGALVTLLNRDVERARKVAKDLGIAYGGLYQIPEHDILVNATSAPMPIAPEKIVAGTIAMDINATPRDTDFVKCAQSKGCRLVYGSEMFHAQARGQFTFWNFTS